MSKQKRFLVGALKIEKFSSLVRFFWGGKEIMYDLWERGGDWLNVFTAYLPSNRHFNAFNESARLHHVLRFHFIYHQVPSRRQFFNLTSDIKMVLRFLFLHFEST